MRSAQLHRPSVRILIGALLITLVLQHVTVTKSGEALFLRLRRAAASFDGRLRAGLGDADVDNLRRLLAQLTENAQPD